MNPGSDERAELRSALRAKRRAIAGPARDAAARRVALLADRANLLLPGRRIGFYLDMPEELPTDALIARARERGCIVCLPRVLSIHGDRMMFLEHQGGVSTGPFGIREPSGGKVLRARQLDTVFVPLVGFDAHGSRLGMGRGYYDRHFAHRLHPGRRPLLVGVGYSVQEIGHLPREPHDVPLDGVVTECALRWFGKGERS